MLVPIAVIAVFSFNDPARDGSTSRGEGFTLEYWANPFAVPELNRRAGHRLELAALSTVVSTTSGR